MRSVAPSTSSRTASPATAALLRLLDELLDVLATVDLAAYRARPAARVSGSVGEHVRHALDHIAALLTARPGAVLSYDHRDRGTDIESDPHAAVRKVFRLRAALEDWAEDGSLDIPVQVSSRMSVRGDTETVWSTRGRELAFVVSHTIHHQAVVAVLLDMLGVGVADRFGCAPSTPIAG